jgi:hypothetical protein
MENNMTTTSKLASAALTGLLTLGMLAASPAFAGEHNKGSCNGKSGCKGKAAAEKSECKGHSAEKTSCASQDKAAAEKASCSGKAADEKASCAAKDVNK